MNEIIKHLVKNVVKHEKLPNRGIRVYTKLAADQTKKFNGGDYDYFTDILQTADGRIRIKEGWSCDLEDYRGRDEVLDVDAISFYLDIVIAIVEYVRGQNE